MKCLKIFELCTNSNVTQTYFQKQFSCETLHHWCIFEKDYAGVAFFGICILAFLICVGLLVSIIIGALCAQYCSNEIFESERLWTCLQQQKKNPIKVQKTWLVSSV